ncbi:MAG: efflux RND transporter periplasmic adaptor subunit [Gammaproteobacteria bacterium]|jgi:HlyD family secretion protein|nr:efflux RND transporter periplasmic adaptor subunit [Gammaproteobacteria bacterium]
MKIRRSIVVISIIGALVLGGIAWVTLSRPDDSEQATYSLSEIKRGNIVSTVSATGTLSPVITVLVGSQVSGTIQHLYVDFNSRVKKGDLIAQIDPALFKARLAEAQANFKSAEAARDKAWIAVLDAKRQLERLQKQQKQKLVSESDVDSARFAYDEAVVEHKIKTAAADQAKAARDREKVNLEYTSIYAPIDGVVISRSVDVGQTVAASLQAPTLFTIAQDLTRMQIETEVDEAFIGMIAPDQPVRFTVFAYQKRQFTGQVAQVRLNPTIEAGVVKYNCIIYVDNSDLALKPGMTATVTIEVARSENVLKVPNAALRFVPDWPAQRLKKLSAGIQANEGVIWLPDGEEVKPLKVALGTTGEKETQISGEGVREGLPIVVPASRKGGERKRRFGLSLF